MTDNNEPSRPGGAAAAASQEKAPENLAGQALLGYDTDTRVSVTIDDRQRRKGLYVLGRPGMGKTTLLQRLMLHDMREGYGLFFVDPHVDAIEELLTLVPQERKEDVIVLNLEDRQVAFGINPLHCKDMNDMKQREDAYAKTYNAFLKIFPTEQGELGNWMSLILTNTIPVLVQNPDYTLTEMRLFLRDKNFRKLLLGRFVHGFKSELMRVHDFWEHELKSRQADPAVDRLLNILRSSYVSHVVGQKTTLNFEKIMEEGKIVLLKLSTELPWDVRKFIGTIVVSEILYTARERPRFGDRRQFCLFADEFQHFATKDFAKLINESRKYKIATTPAHQVRGGQLKGDPDILNATQACASMVLFKTAVDDAGTFAPEFAKYAEEEMEASHEAEPIITLHAVELICEKGHQDRNIVQISRDYFWLVDLLKSRPEDNLLHKDSFFHFDPSRFSGLDFSAYDWDEYRATPDMVRRALLLLDQYYFDAMQGDGPNAGLVVEVMQNIGGLFGFYPAMRPFLPDSRRRLLFTCITNYEKCISLKKNCNSFGPGAKEVLQGYFLDYLCRSLIPQSFRDAYKDTRQPWPDEAWGLKKYLGAWMFRQPPLVEKSISSDSIEALIFGDSVIEPDWRVQVDYNEYPTSKAREERLKIIYS